jgi:hypothetical protein
MTTGREPPSPPPSRLSIGEVLGESWLLYTRNAPRLIATAAAVFGVLSLVDALVDATTGARFILVAVSVAVSVVGSLWLQGALVVLVEEFRAGRTHVPIRHVFERLEPRLATLLAAGLLAAAGIAAGLVAFVLPGLVLLTLWSMITPAVVLEGRGVREAFARSMRLVRGNELRVFVVIVLTVLLATAVGAVISSLFAPLPGFLAYYAGSVVASSVTVPFVALCWTVMYFDLRAGR